MSAARPAVVRFYFDADVLGLAHVVASVAVELRKDQLVVFPRDVGCRAFGVLLFPLCAQHLDQLGGDGDTSSTAVGLGLLVDEPLTANSVHTTPYDEGSLVEVEIAPAKCERLRLAQSEGQRHRPPGRVATALRGSEHRPGFFRIERLRCLRPTDGRWIDQRGDVAGDGASLHGDLERSAQDSVDSQDRRW